MLNIMLTGGKYVIVYIYVTYCFVPCETCSSIFKSEIVFELQWCCCMTLRPVLHAQAKKKKKEEAANAKLLEAEKRIKVSLDENQSFYFSKIKTMCCYTSINYIYKKNSSPQNNYLKKCLAQIQHVYNVCFYCMYIVCLCFFKISLYRHYVMF